MSDKISIIIAVYNCDKYIENCIDSILIQSYKNIELIIVDDCSTDNTLSIIKQKMELDCRIKLIVNIKNMGVSYSRNKGLQQATGKYVLFVDGDDYLKQNYIDKFMTLKNLNSLIIGNYTIFNGKNEIENNKLEETNIDILTAQKNTLLPTSKEKYNSIVVWGKMYDLNLIKKNNIKFIENLKKYEDGLFNYEYLHYCCNVNIINNTGYVYRVSDTSTVGRYILDFNEDEKIFTVVTNTINKYKENELLKDELNVCKLTLMINILKNHILHKDNTDKIIIKLKKIRKLYINNKKYIKVCKLNLLTKKQKIIIILFKIKLYFLLIFY